jgi:hypothetical protein
MWMKMLMKTTTRRGIVQVDAVAVEYSGTGCTDDLCGDGRLVVREGGGFAVSVAVVAAVVKLAVEGAEIS